MFHLMSPQVRLGLSQSRRVVSSQAVLDSSDDDDFDVAKSQPRNNATKTPGARVRFDNAHICLSICICSISCPLRFVSASRRAAVWYPRRQLLTRLTTISTWPSRSLDFQWQRKSGAIRVLRSRQTTWRLQRRLSPQKGSRVHPQPKGSSMPCRTPTATATLIWRSMYSEVLSV